MQGTSSLFNMMKQLEDGQGQFLSPKCIPFKPSIVRISILLILFKIHVILFIYPSFPSQESVNAIIKSHVHRYKQGQEWRLKCIWAWYTLLETLEFPPCKSLFYSRLDALSSSSESRIQDRSDVNEDGITPTLAVNEATFRILLSFVTKYR